MINFMCGYCHRKLRAPVTVAGRCATCTVCARTTRVPHVDFGQVPWWATGEAQNPALEDMAAVTRDSILELSS